jgi:hypothetical protein
MWEETVTPPPDPVEGSDVEVSIDRRIASLRHSVEDYSRLSGTSEPIAAQPAERSRRYSVMRRGRHLIRAHESELWLAAFLVTISILAGWLISTYS